jgi:sortase A
MSGRAFLYILIILGILAILTQPAVLKPLLRQEAVRPAVTAGPTVTPTTTATPDPFAAIPVATTMGRGSGPAYVPVTPALDLLPTSLPPVETTRTFTALLPNTLATPKPAEGFQTNFIPPAPTPAGIPPDRLSIPRLNLDVPIEPVGMAPSDVAPGVVEWGVPEHRAAGWLNTSAPFGRPGNTVLDGHHNIKSEVFRDLWTLQAGDAILLAAGDASQRYVVDEVLILPERDQPLDVRLRNAGYIQPTDDERLTLVTCWPYDDNSHRTLVVARPRETP